MRGSAMFVSDDPDDFGACLTGLAMRVFVSGPGPFSVRVTQVGCRSVILTVCHETLPRIAHLTLPHGTMGLLFPTCAGPPPSIGGITVEYGTIALLGAGHRCHFCTPADFHWAAIIAKTEQLAARGHHYAWLAITDPETLHVMTPARADLRRLLRLHLRATRAAQFAPEMLRATESARGLENSMVEALSACLSNGRCHASPRRLSHARIMNAVEDILDGGQDMPISPAALSEQLGISGRSLRFFCQEHLGMSPEVYMRLRRLGCARRDLQRSDPGALRVKEIAARHGFSDMSRFATRYRACFGESPSATLRRNRLG